MWAQVLDGPFRFQQVDVEAPGPGDLADGQVLVAARAGGICGSDLPFFKGAPFQQSASPAGGTTAPPGFPLHEIVGEVVASRHPAHSPGELVVGWASAFDGIAEFVVSDGEGLAGYDPALPATTAVMLQPLACVLYAVEQLGDVGGRTVAVVGQGPIGLLFSHVLKQRGAGRVVGVDRVDRSGSARVFGVDEVVTSGATQWAAGLAEADRPALVVEAVGHQVTTLRDCVTAAAPGGEILYYGIPDDPVYPLELYAMVRKNLTLRAGVTRDRRRVLHEAGSYLAAHPELRDGYVSDVHPVGDVTAAFAAAIQPRAGQFKIVLELT
ncbi:zinc-binding dehydrogenase [Blastococcus xanthinilyticus]|uniref:Threonine dehydrogenase-like Zn-dependent dehydrogenase n=1 Tax=Blastococcus xanthinilyticus TaxID=1564164 RepID=A0A5S5CYV1_9ACTN|nr:zinc-binding dehydrogenase [Blastococcus xanthinilyticus]TYP88941.1 threonine dehydrogenase-like Zn-dependent dehydrogenase [Blastococcus xanthinilyticus]